MALRDGRALVLGGSPDDETLLETTELFDPDTERFTAGPGLHEPRYKLPGGAVVLGDHVVVAGGGGTVEDLDLGTGRSRVLAEQRVRGSFATINRLGRRDLLVIGGYDARIRLRREAFVLPAPVQVMTGHASAVPPAERGRSGPHHTGDRSVRLCHVVRTSMEKFGRFLGHLQPDRWRTAPMTTIPVVGGPSVRAGPRSRGPSTGRGSAGRPGGHRGTGSRRRSSPASSGRSQTMRTLPASPPDGEPRELLGGELGVAGGTDRGAADRHLDDPDRDRDLLHPPEAALLLDDELTHLVDRLAVAQTRNPSTREAHGHCADHPICTVVGRDRAPGPAEPGE